MNVGSWLLEVFFDSDYTTKHFIIKALNMKTILKIAWRNIWRNSVRSSIVILSIALGLLAGLFASALVKGLMKQKINTVIEKEISHIQVHDTSFREDFELKYTIENAEKIETDFSENKEVLASSSRAISMVMIASSKKSGAIKAIGVDPKNEVKVTNLNENILEGKYFEGVKRNPIVISQKTAEDYKLKLKSKLVLTMQDLDGEIVAGSFRVAGIFKTDNVMYDEMNVFVQKTDLQKLLGLENKVHEIAVLLKEHDAAESLAIQFQEKYPNQEILPWLDIAPGMRLNTQILDIYTYIIVGIILFALLFSIVNTMLMAVLEREKELSVLISIGMVKTKIFAMIMFETIFYAVTGGAIGFLIAYSLITYFSNNGMSMAAYEDVGFSSVVYPYLGAKEYLNVSFMVVFMAIFAAIYPALKAMRFSFSDLFGRRRNK